MGGATQEGCGLVEYIVAQLMHKGSRVAYSGNTSSEILPNKEAGDSGTNYQHYYSVVSSHT